MVAFSASRADASNSGGYQTSTRTCGLPGPVQVAVSGGAKPFQAVKTTSWTSSARNLQETPSAPFLGLPTVSPLAATWNPSGTTTSRS